MKKLLTLTLALVRATARVFNRRLRTPKLKTLPGSIPTSTSSLRRPSTQKPQNLPIPVATRLDSFIESDSELIDLIPEPVEIISVEVLAIAPPSIHPVDLSLVQPPDGVEVQTVPNSMTRSQIVAALLDEAYSQGKRSYADLISHVESATGKGCSKQTIARWKRERKLSADAA